MSDIALITGEVSAQVFNPESAFGGVVIEVTGEAPVQVQTGEKSPVVSVFGRIGAVAPALADYDQFYALKAAGVPSGGALHYVLRKASATSYDLEWAAQAGAQVASVFGRTGAVVAATGDYTAAKVTNALDSTQTYANPTWLSSLAWAKITGAPAFITGNQTITLTGDATGSGATSIPVTIPGKTNWDTAYTDRLKWDGGATGLNAATGRTSLGLVIGTNVEAYLGNPSTNGYILSSSTAGVRSWIAPPAGGGGVTSVFGRTGAVVALSGDYSTFYPQLDSSYVNPVWISSLAWSKITGAPAFVTSAEPPLGNPSADGYILSSTAAGTRSWVAASGGGNVSSTGTPATGQHARWTGATTIEGYTPPVPVNVVFFVTAGTATYTPTAGVRALWVECIGGGGGGGGAKATASNATAGGGGGGGAYCARFLTAPLKASYSVTVGAPGTAGPATGGAGGAGGSTSFDSPSVATAGGGVGGAGSAVGQTVPAFPTNGGAGGTPAGGQFHILGGDGNNGCRLSATQTLSGQGGSGARGGGGTKGVGGDSAGVQGSYWGGGGSGASSNSATGFAGGGGYTGIIMITEYF
jgi:hypothetical protein